MTERAEGLWWVRWKDDPLTPEKWRTGEVVGVCGLDGTHLVLWVLHLGGRDELELDDPAIEWGHYLGKEPGDHDEDLPF